MESCCGRGTLGDAACYVTQGLLGGLSNMLETLRGESAPPPACRAVVYAALRYLDAELLNALMLRRDCCSISAIKALNVRSPACDRQPNLPQGALRLEKMDIYLLYYYYKCYNIRNRSATAKSLSTMRHRHSVWPSNTLVLGPPPQQWLREALDHRI